ncbi:MAG: AAA family ATPase, partial [Tumebacillaceae bacterium]
MKIQKIEIKNFRGFYDMVLELNGESAILVGKNGAGKSSLLDAA